MTARKPINTISDTFLIFKILIRGSTIISKMTPWTLLGLVLLLKLQICSKLWTCVIIELRKSTRTRVKVAFKNFNQVCGLAASFSFSTITSLSFVFSIVFFGSFLFLRSGSLQRLCRSPLLFLSLSSLLWGVFFFFFFLFGAAFGFSTASLLSRSSSRDSRRFSQRRPGSWSAKSTCSALANQSVRTISTLFSTWSFSKSMFFLFRWTPNASGASFSFSRQLYMEGIRRIWQWIRLLWLADPWSLSLERISLTANRCTIVCFLLPNTELFYWELSAFLSWSELLLGMAFRACNQRVRDHTRGGDFLGLERTCFSGLLLDTTVRFQTACT